MSRRDSGPSWASSLRDWLFRQCEHLWDGPTEAVKRHLILFVLLAPVLMVALQHAPTALTLGFGLAVLPLGLWAYGLTFLQVNFYAGLALAAFVCLVAISSLWSHYPARSLKAAADVGAYSLATMLLLRAVSHQHDTAIRGIWTCLVAGSVAAVLLFIPLQFYAAFHPVPLDPPMHKVSLYALMAGVVVHQALRCGTLGRSWYLLIAALGGVIFLGYSNTSQLRAVLLIGILFLPLRAATRLFLLILGSFVVASLAVPVVAKPLFTYLDTIGILSFHSNTIGARLELWAAVSDAIWEHPFIGHGAKAVRLADELVSHTKYFGRPNIISAHNNSVEIWYDLGLLGIVFYLALMVSFGLVVVRWSGVGRRTGMALFLCVLIPFSVDHSLWLSWLLGYVGISVFIAMLAHREALRMKCAPGDEMP